MTDSLKRAKRKKQPKHTVTGRAYRFQIEPSTVLNKKLFAVLGLCWEARNLLAAERQENRELNRALRDASEPVKYLTRADQYVRMALLPKSDARFKAVHSQVLQNVAVRVDEGTSRWLEALTSGRKQVARPDLSSEKTTAASLILNTESRHTSNEACFTCRKSVRFRFGITAKCAASPRL